MISVFNSFLLISAICLLVPCILLFVECVAALLPKRVTPCESLERARFCVIVPAHNEQRLIAGVVRALRKELAERDRLLVVADNCHDATAVTASAAGAEVIERNDLSRPGKGHALAFAVRHLTAEPPEVVIFVDADCEIQPHSIDIIARRSKALGRPIQARYLMQPPSEARVREGISRLAIRVKNQVRPSGLARLGLPCQLAGSGMAIPWDVLGHVCLESNNVADDMVLGVDLMVAGYLPIFETDASVTGYIPGKALAARMQRTRWEHGHLSTLLSQAPRLVVEGVRQRRWELIAMAIDLSIPPLALLVLILGAAGLLSVLAQAWPAALVILTGIILVGTAILSAWACFARQEIPLKSLASIPFYVCGKLPIYLTFLWRRKTQWVGTARTASAPDAK